jgi:hypothetical protein
MSPYSKLLYFAILVALLSGAASARDIPCGTLTEITGQISSDKPLPKGSLQITTNDIVVNGNERFKVDHVYADPMSAEAEALYEKLRKLAATGKSVTVTLTGKFNRLTPVQQERTGFPINFQFSRYRLHD